jgi:hypothetical protein
MTPARQLPVPDAPPPASWQSFKTRLENWVLSVYQTFSGQILRQVVVTAITPDMPSPGMWYGTTSFTVEVDASGIPQAQLVANGVVQFFTVGALAPGQWNIQQVNVGGIMTTAVVVGAPVTQPVWFSFLVVR